MNRFNGEINSPFSLPHSISDGKPAPPDAHFQQAWEFFGDLQTMLKEVRATAWGWWLTPEKPNPRRLLTVQFDAYRHSVLCLYFDEWEMEAKKGLCRVVAIDGFERFASREAFFEKLHQRFLKKEPQQIGLYEVVPITVELD
jgi:hypothetical protein